MQDIYAAIVGEPPTEQEKLATLAKKLRNQQLVGQLGALTGDKVLSPMGQGIGKQVEEQAQTIGGYQARRRELDAQEAMRAASALERAKEAELNRAHDLDLLAREQSFQAAQKAQDRALRKALEAMGGDKKDYKTIPAKQFEGLTNEAQETYDIDSVITNFQDTYATAGIPGSREAANTAVSMGMPVSENAEKAAGWWADYERLYTLPTRNKLFGSALTAPERAAWEKNAISPSMKPEVIRQRLKSMQELKNKALARKRDSFIKAGYDPEQVDAAFESYASPTEDEIIDLPPR